MLAHRNLSTRRSDRWTHWPLSDLSVIEEARKQPSWSRRLAEAVRTAAASQLGNPGTGAALAAKLLLGGGLVCGLVAFFAAGNTAVQIIAGSLALSSLGVAAALFTARDASLGSSLAAGQLGPWFAVSTAVVFGLASFTWLASPSSDQPFHISRAAVVAAMFVVGIALGCFVLAYLRTPAGIVGAGASGLERILAINRPVRPGRRAAWLLFGLALMAYAAQIANKSFGYVSDPAALITMGSPISQPLYILSTFSFFAIALAASDYALQRGRGRLLTVIAMIAIQSTVGAFSGSKEVIGVGLAAALFGYAAGARRLPITGLTIASLGFVFIVVPVVTSYRSAVTANNARLSPMGVVGQLWGHGPSVLLPGLEGNGGESAAVQTVKRLSRIGDVAIIVQRTTPQDIPYRPLSELLEAPLLGLVPRAIWHDKPVLAAGYRFSQQYYDLPSSMYTSSAVTPQGDLWRHGGWAVLIIGMLFLGSAVRILDAAGFNVRAEPLRLLLVLSFFTIVVKQETDFVTILASIPSLLFGVAVAARLVARREVVTEPSTD